MARPVFRPGGQGDLAPSGAAAKLAANLAALEVLAACRAESRAATAAEQAVLGRWAGWGAVPQVFDPDDDRYAAERGRVRELLGSDEAWAQARRTVLNAHYTDAAVVTAMWDAVRGLGFETGRVLEPGCGSGNFIGFAPDGATLQGVELDSTTAAVARLLYPHAEVYAGGFERFDAPDGSFDLAIGNVPFAKVALHDPRHNRNRHSIHNHFLVKSLHLVRPGGLVAALTSRFTMDARNPAARREIAGLADLVGAVRLPNRAFAAAAGTDAILDLLVLRRRPDGAEPEGPAWELTVPIDAPGADPAGPPLMTNQFFADRPDVVLGDLHAGRGMYGPNELMVSAPDDLPARLTAALDALVADAHQRGATLTPTPTHRSVGVPVVRAAGDGFDLTYAQEGSFVAGPHGQVARCRGGVAVVYEPRFKKDAAELARLVGLRDAARAVLAVQVTGGPDTDLAAAQRVLNERYDRYVRLYGPINRFSTARTGRYNPDTGDEVLRRVRPRMGGFRDDADWPLVAALEVFDDESQSARKAAIFAERVVSPPPTRLGVDTPDEAIAVCLDETGTVTLERVAELLGTASAETRAQLVGLVYDDPETGRLVPANEYLSGNIRTKLTAAERAAADDPARWEANVTALREAMPTQLEPADITARFGAPWIPPADIEQFCTETLGARVDVEHLAAVGQWAIKLAAGPSDSVALTSEWGTARANAVTLIDAALNQRLATVWDVLPDGRRVRNDNETLAARAKQEALGERFAEWVWHDPARAQRLAGRYNELFRSVRLATYDGSHLSLPGLSDAFVPRQHQRDAVARILQDGRAMLAHEVGAGKTVTMVMAAMELRRLGSANKPAVVVPNHMLDQFSREWLQAYPTARLLIADKDRLSRERRTEFVARCATGDWDGIVFTQSGFAKLPLGDQLTADYLRIELDAARSALNASTSDGKGLSVKRMEARIAQLEETYNKLLDGGSKDDGIRFEETGIDYVFVDEAHLFKNKRVVTSIDGVSSGGSQRAQDLDAKLWALRQHHGPRTVTFATATPVANSIAELWVMESYLHPDTLQTLGLHAFDSWAATFGRTHTALELAPDGGSYRMKTRFARFQNVPELLALWRQIADVRTAEDLGLPVPTIAGGKPEVVIVPASDTLKQFVADLADRAEQIRKGTVRPEDDNMLKISSDGRRAALDPRLVGLPADHDAGKIAAVAPQIAAIHHQVANRTYLDDTGQPAARPGGLQLVFCDTSTPASDGWNAYDELRAQLIRRGIPDHAIRYMQDARDDTAKARLFAACRDGTVAVLIGSTETMGVGTNVQTRAVAEHDIDAPWRPADVKQRTGRVERQGNQNPEIRILRYVTEGSFDTYMWQTLERKAAFIGQITRGDLPDREIDDIGDQALSFAEIKALASGDPRIMEKAGVDADVARLTRLERAHHDDQARLRVTVERANQRTRALTRRITELTGLHEQTTDTRGDLFRITIDSTDHTKRVDAGEHLRTILIARLDATPIDERTPTEPIATLGGHTIHAYVTRWIADEVRLTIPALDVELAYTAADWRNAEPAGIMQRLEHQLRRIPTMVDDARSEIDRLGTEADRARTRLGQPFEHTDQLAQLRRRQAALDEALSAPPDPQPPTPVTDVRARLEHLTTTAAPNGPVVG